MSQDMGVEEAKEFPRNNAASGVANGAGAADRQHAAKALRPSPPQSLLCRKHHHATVSE